MTGGHSDRVAVGKAGHLATGTVLRSLLILGAVLLALLAAANSATARPGPTAAYSFNESEGETVHDAAGSHNGTIHGATWTEEGKYGDALEFDGEEDHVTIPDSEDLDFTEGFTLEAWVDPSEAHNWSSLIAKEDGSESLPFSYLLYGQGGGEVPVIYMVESESELTHNDGETPLPLNSWSHLAVTSDGEHSRIYINGELDSVGPALPVKATNGPLQIGGNEVFGEPFKGKIDEVRLYGEVLGSEEIAEDMASPLAESEETEPPHCSHVEAGALIEHNAEVTLDCLGPGALSYELASEPEHGSISEFNAEAGTLTYTPESEFTGTDDFSFHASNAFGTSNTATAAVRICSRPYIEVGGEAFNPELPGVDLFVRASPGEIPCKVGPEEYLGMTELRVYIDDELVYSEALDCEKVKSPCPLGSFSRTIPLPYAKVIGTHSFRVESESQAGIAPVPREWTGATPEEGTIAPRFGKAEDKAGSKGCETPKDRHKYYKRIENILYGTECADKMGATNGIKAYEGGPENDVIHGGSTPDHLDGGAGKDELFGNRGNDTLKGGAQDDKLFGGPGDDILLGGQQDDLLVGSAGRDTIKGEDGNDLVRGGATTDTLSGGNGENTLSYADGVTPGFHIFPPGKGPDPLKGLVAGFPEKHDSRGLYIDLREVHPRGDDGEVARYGGGNDIVRASEFQNVIGTAFADFIIGSEGPNEIDGGPGTDIIRGAGGSDQLYGGADDDYIDGGEEQAGGEVVGGSGTDICFKKGGAEAECDTSSSEAELSQPSEEVVSVGVLETDPGLSEGDVYVLGSMTKDKITATWSAGTVTLKVPGGVEGKFDPKQVDASGCTSVEEKETEAKCPLTGGASLMIYGNSGSDSVTATALPQDSSVTLLGGTNGDTLVGGGETDDVLVDGPGAYSDRLVGKNGDDAIYSNEGKDSLVGGAGGDLFASAEYCDGDTIAGGSGSDNANWAQLVGEELEPENPEYPINPEEEELYEPVVHGAEVSLMDHTISEQSIGCSKEGEEDGNIFGVENLEGSHGADVLVGNEAGNVLLGRAGPDVLRGLQGNDRILANNANRHNAKTNALKRDLDTEINCGAGTDHLKMDRADKKHLALEGCEPPPLSRVRPGRQYQRSDGTPSEEVEESRDESEIGAVEDETSMGPEAFFKLDEVGGAIAGNWAEDGGPSSEVEGEPDEEFGEEIEEEEAEVAAGSYEGGVELGQPGAIEESQAVHLNGTDAYIDLTSNWDPWDAVDLECGGYVNGYSVELWVKFDEEASGREELFSRSDAGEGTFIYRSGDGKLNFSEVRGIESPVVSTYEPVGTGEWHHIVATMAEVTEGCASFAGKGVSLEGPDETEGRIALYVDGFPYALGIGRQPFPPYLPSAHNIVGAREGESSFSNFLEGTVDDVAIYEEPLGYSEIESHLGISEVPEPSIMLEPGSDLEDSDEDGVVDSRDNCPEVSNPEQEDSDWNGIGDACQVEEDSDEDGVVDEVDNCPDVPNSLQEDADENGIGDACEPE